MVINFYGEGCFKVQSGEFTLLTDPFEKNTGLTPPRLKSNLILKTLVPFPPEVFWYENDSKEIVGAGEYNIGEITIKGFFLAEESTEKYSKIIYLADIEGCRLCFLGHLSVIPEPSVLEFLEGIDILFIPAGGKPFLEQKLAIKLLRQLEPKIIIPSFFKIASLKRQSDDIKEFLQEFNGPKDKEIKRQDKFSIRQSGLRDIASTEVVVLIA